MSTKTALATQEWVLEELMHLYRQHPERVQGVLERVLEEDEELCWAVVVHAYLEKRINLGKAAELLGMHELELRERFMALGIPLRIGPADVAEARAEVEAVRSWFREEEEGTFSP